MKLRVLSSGSKGNATLIRVDELRLLVDAGLPMTQLNARLEAAQVPFDGVDHIAVTHGHLDHARSSGALSKRHKRPSLSDKRLLPRKWQKAKQYSVQCN